MQDNFIHRQETHSSWVQQGLKDERGYNFYSANASYEMAKENGEQGASLLRHNLIRRRALTEPVEAFFMLKDSDVPALKNYVAECAEKRKLKDVRKWIEELDNKEKE